MYSSLPSQATSRSESLAFLSLSANDLDCIGKSKPSQKASSNAKPCAIPKVQAVGQEDLARAALCDVIKTMGASRNSDEFAARRDRLFPRYCDLMLGLGRIVNALTDPAELILKTKAQLAAEEVFFSGANSLFCPPHLKDQALFSLWELGKVVDLVDFIRSRPLPVDKFEQDQRHAANCTMSILFGRMHLDCLGFAVGSQRRFGEDVEDLLSAGMRHIVNGHIAARFGARLRQEIVTETEVELVPFDDEDHIAVEYATARFGEDEY